MQNEAKRFLDRAEEQLRGMYRDTASGKKPSEVERATIVGFMQAGIFLKLTTIPECNALVEKVHLEELGETIEERKVRKKFQGQDEQLDFSKYDSPTYTRIKRK